MFYKTSVGERVMYRKQSNRATFKNFIISTKFCCFGRVFFLKHFSVTMNLSLSFICSCIDGFNVYFYSIVGVREVDIYCRDICFNVKYFCIFFCLFFFFLLHNLVCVERDTMLDKRSMFQKFYFILFNFFF